MAARILLLEWEGYDLLRLLKKRADSQALIGGEHGESLDQLNCDDGAVLYMDVTPVFARALKH
jgi:hypothetical protein